MTHTKASSFMFMIIFINGINSHWIKLSENPKFEEVDCNSLQIEVYCTAPQVNKWCKWNSELSICQENYNPILFISPWDPAAITKSMINMLILIGVMILYYISGLITSKVFKNIESDKRDKCRIYIFEFLGLTISLSYFLYAGTFNMIFIPQKYYDVEPVPAEELVQSLSMCIFVCYMYLIEMLANKLRWSLQLHHTVVIFTALYYQLLLDGYADIASLRCILAITLYPFTEHNVFVQLFLYRIQPLFSWKFHFVSSVFYTLTRIFGTVTFIYCWISWAMTDRIYDQFHGEKWDVPYMIFFFLFPIIIVLLNVAQYQTVKALFYITKSTRRRIKIHNELKNNPRLQQLYDIFIEFDGGDNGYWTMMDWKRFIFYNSTFIKHETCILLWNVLGFSNKPSKHGISPSITSGDSTDGATTKIDKINSASNDSVTGSDSDHDGAGGNAADEQAMTTIISPHVPSKSGITEQDINGFEDKIQIKQNKKHYMKWKDFRAIFAKHVLNEQFMHYSVKQIVSAQLQVLIQTMFNAEAQFEIVDDKDKAMLKLYKNVNTMIMNGNPKSTRRQGKISRRLSKVAAGEAVTEEKESGDDHVISMSPPPTIEMYIGADMGTNDVELPSRDLPYAATVDVNLLDKQLELDDVIRQNSTRVSSIMMMSGPTDIEQQQTI